MDLVESLKTATDTAGKPMVIFLDQFEEFFVVYQDQEELRTTFIEALAQVRYNTELPVYIVLSLREDYFARLHELRSAIPSIFHHNANVRLERFTKQQSVRAIEGPLQVVGGAIDQDLAERIFDDLAAGASTVEPIKLQVVCQYLWQRRTPEIWINTSTYNACGGAEKILADDLARRLGSIPLSRHRLMTRVFDALKTPDGTKRFRSSEDLADAVGWRSLIALEDLLNSLADNKILRWEPGSGTVWYELRHDYLVGAISDWLAEREARLAKRRLWLVAIPGMVLFAALLIYIGVSYATVYAVLTPQQYDDQLEEIAIERGRPFGVKIFSEIGTTGLFLPDLSDLETRNAVRSRLRLGLLANDEWELLSRKLNRAAAARFLFDLGHDGQGMEALLEALSDNDPDIRSSAITMFAEVGTGEQVIDSLLEALQDTNNDVRRAAAAALREHGKADKRTIGPLLQALGDDDDFVRRYAAMALGKFGKVDEQVIGNLLEALRDTDVAVRGAVGWALGQLGKANEHVVDSLLNLLRDNDNSIRSRAAWVLSKLDNADDRVIVALLTALRDNDSSVRRYAASALGQVGNADGRVTDSLLITLRDHDSRVRFHAASALRVLGTAEDLLIETFLEALGDSDSSVRRAAARVLGGFGAPEERLIDPLMKALRDNDSSVRSSAASALGEIGATEERVIEVLIEATGDVNFVTQASAVRALGKVDTRVAGSIESLVEALRDDRSYIRSTAVRALGEVDISEEQVIELLVESLRDSGNSVRSSAASTLGDLLWRRPEAELLADLEDRESAHRIPAAQALVRKEILSEETLAKIEALRRRDHPPWARLGGSEAARLIRQRRKSESKADELMKKGDRLVDDGEDLAAARRYESAYQALTNPIRLRKQAASAAFQAARCYAKLGRSGSAIHYLKPTFDNDPTLREVFKTELAQPSSDWASIREDHRLERLLRNVERTADPIDED